MATENFEQCLSRLLKKYNLNYSELSRKLNYSSKNTLYRILNGESGEKSRHKVFSDIAENTELGFSTDDIRELEQALKISAVGSDKYQAVIEMRNLMLKKNQSTSDIALNDIYHSKEISLYEFSTSIKNNKNEIIILNCSWAQVASCMKELLTVSEESHLIQYMILTEKTADIVRQIESVLPIINYSNYNSYSIETKNIPQDITDEFSHNLIAIRSTERNGKIHHYSILLHNDHSGILFHESCDHYNYWFNKGTTITKYVLPIKINYTQDQSPEAYLKFTELYYQMEKDTNIYTYKPDISFIYINAPITKAALIDGLKNIGNEVPNSSAFKSLIDKLEDIHTKRYDNIFSKKNVTQHVLSEKAMKEFVKTGTLSDHFFIMRPYTVKERIEILKDLLYHIENNPHFNIHLLKYDDIFLNMEACFFEDVGVRFTPMSTNYNMENNHAEAVVNHKAFTDLYKELFTGVLLQKYVKSQTETVNLFKSLISELEASV